jgi:prefoldin subunit 5
MGSNDPKISQIQTNFQTLSTVASSLNVASDELTKGVRTLDEALKKLNVGLTVWVVFEDRSDEQYPDQYDCDQIGYCKVNGKWGISLRRIWGHEFHGAGNEEGPWLFTDAPREMRLRSVDKIPVLIEALSKEASNTTKKIQEKTKEVSELAAAIESAADEAKRKAPTLAERVAAARAKAKLVDQVRKANAGIVAGPGEKAEGSK